MAATACAAVDDVDSCWKDGVLAERRGDAAAAFAAYDRSCSAGLTIYGCYEAGKIAFLNPALRDYRLARKRMARVCASRDVGMGPYGCTYLGIMQRDGLGGERLAGESAYSFVRACFTHNADHNLDGRGCAALGDGLPTARVMGRSDAQWPHEYLRYLAYAMGCTDGMPALCAKAGEIYRAGEAASADWLVLCEDPSAPRAPAGTCQMLADPALSAENGQRQILRRTLAGRFVTVTGLPAVR
ncbi:hypothetical protein [Sphingomonas desiccabilis]|uniref:Beta-lactamase n=1 Tax=Sphingomonas desiccabilis TaxID=429134 RepID=A0A4Q2IZZ7_9SPHN|nr:hypothetical protein [Sphingomonas desiccabilis]MBB3910459.1 TPR repeat protein [Sphingomonas desiccabilis]RXZ35108.1 hypothetical protein EO081_05555 [Sphingomonas desiccabilis]